MITMLFSTTPKDVAIERMMTGVPNFPPRGHGSYVLRKFRYTAKDCDCRLCPYYDRKLKCKLQKCECMEERIEASVVSYAELINHVFTPCENTALQKRIKQYSKESEDTPVNYRGKSHKTLLQNIASKKQSCENKTLAALYLLTADSRLWSKAKHFVTSDGIDFSAIHLGNVSPDAYTLFMTAKDLYCGTKHMTISDLADTELISPKMFAVLCNAMMIRRYGKNAVEIMEKEGADRC